MVTPFKREKRYTIVKGLPEIYTKPLQGEHKTRLIKIYTGRQAVIELWAVAEIKGRFYSARTIFTAFNHSGQKDTQAQRLQTKPQWPSLDLTQPGRHYYSTQAGNKSSFALKDKGKIQSQNKTLVRVFENGKEIGSGLSPTPDHEYNHTPAVDSIMTAPGYSEIRDLLLVATTNGGKNILSYYLPVHRATYGHYYLKPGLIVLGLGVLINLGWIYVRGRRFKWK